MSGPRVSDSDAQRVIDLRARPIVSFRSREQEEDMPLVRVTDLAADLLAARAEVASLRRDLEHARDEERTWREAWGQASRDLEAARGDWGKLCEQIALQVGDEDDHDAADATDPAFLEQFDPWACLRRAGEMLNRLGMDLNATVAENARLRAALDLARRYLEGVIRNTHDGGDPWGTLRWIDGLASEGLRCVEAALTPAPAPGPQPEPAPGSRLVGESCYHCNLYVYGEGLCRLADADACEVATCPHWEAKPAPAPGPKGGES